MVSEPTLQARGQPRHPAQQRRRDLGGRLRVHQARTRRVKKAGARGPAGPETQRTRGTPCTQTQPCALGEANSGRGAVGAGEGSPRAVWLKLRAFWIWGQTHTHSRGPAHTATPARAHPPLPPRTLRGRGFRGSGRASIERPPGRARRASGVSGRPREAPHPRGPDRGLVLREPVLRLHCAGKRAPCPPDSSCTHEPARKPIHTVLRKGNLPKIRIFSSLFLSKRTHLRNRSKHRRRKLCLSSF